MAHFDISPVLTLDHCWINKADTKYNAQGLFKTEGIGSGPLVEAMKDNIKAASMAALANETAEMKPAEAKKWSLYVPFEEVEDDDGNPTGDTRFTFKQNQVIKTKDGKEKTITIEVRDSADNVVDGVNVFSGTKARIMFSMRPIKMVSTKEVGVRLDFAKVQIVELSKGSGGSMGFGAVDGGFVSSGDKASHAPASQTTEEDLGDEPVDY